MKQKIKFCSKCSKTLSVEKFSKARGAKDGLYYYCRECCRKVNKEYRIRLRNSTNDLKYLKITAYKNLFLNLPANHKPCSVCLKVLPLEKFMMDRVGKFGKKSQCRDCINKKPIENIAKVTETPTTNHVQNIEELNLNFLNFIGKNVLKPDQITYEKFCEFASYLVTHSKLIKGRRELFNLLISNETIKKNYGKNTTYQLLKEILKIAKSGMTIKEYWEKGRKFCLDKKLA